MSSLDCNNNQELLRRAALVQELTQTTQPSPYSAAGKDGLVMINLHHLTFCPLQNPRRLSLCRTVWFPPTERRPPSWPTPRTFPPGPRLCQPARRWRWLTMTPPRNLALDSWWPRRPTRRRSLWPHRSLSRMTPMSPWYLSNLRSSSNCRPHHYLSLTPSVINCYKKVHLSHLLKASVSHLTQNHLLLTQTKYY